MRDVRGISQNGRKQEEGRTKANRSAEETVPEPDRVFAHTPFGATTLQGGLPRDGGAGRDTSGRGERIRTSDILLPKQARYRAALRPDKTVNYRGLGGQKQTGLEMRCTPLRCTAIDDRADQGDANAFRAALAQLFTMLIKILLECVEHLADGQFFAFAVKFKADAGLVTR